jgi:hypothetical protein
MAARAPQRARPSKYAHREGLDLTVSQPGYEGRTSYLDSLMLGVECPWTRVRVG